MDETRKISLLFQHSGRTKNAAELLVKVRQNIKDLKENQPELKEYYLANVGMYRDSTGIRVNLYFIKGEKTAYVSAEKRANI
ncbi:hypothetical protein [Candidatus Formimonas warabiya]|uniref:Uncharacterized protein n=1 Tax=Formimonas warabiya TaxID=1761012 RepID=A0A3G1KPD1_FORW1|nr:hypothetical protein [Candidatus Formimonas warabiya]ATW23985.1 hypothetical protein DCMF_03540 [Candidatus Formimonas warabiya]